MSQSLKWRTALVVVVAGLGILFLLPTLLGSAEKAAANGAANLKELLAVQGVENCRVEAVSREILVLAPDAETADRVTELVREAGVAIELRSREQNESGVSLTLKPTAETGLPGFLPQERLHLGLDLQGGMHLVLEVEADKAVDHTIERLADELKTALRDKRIRSQGAEMQKREIRVTVRDAEAAEKAAELVADDFRELEEVRREARDGGVSLILKLKAAEAQYIRDYAVRRASRPSAIGWTSSASRSRPSYPRASAVS
jgi:hypothetical protein